jgi:hypothetical protein
VLDPHERSIARAEEELRIHERAEHCATRRCVESPEATRLRFCESQSRHFKELTLDTPKHLVNGMSWVRLHETLSGLTRTATGKQWAYHERIFGYWAKSSAEPSLPLRPPS